MLAQVAGDWDESRRRCTAAELGVGTLGTPVVDGLAVAGLARCDEIAGEMSSARDRYADVLATGRRWGSPD